MGQTRQLKDSVKLVLKEKIQQHMVCKRQHFKQKDTNRLEIKEWKT